MICRRHRRIDALKKLNDFFTGNSPNPVSSTQTLVMRVHFAITKIQPVAAGGVADPARLLRRFMIPKMA
jgi:hypothetical protein